jgi:hypothetical protein
MTEIEAPSRTEPASDERGCRRGPFPANRAGLIAIAESDYAPRLVGIERDRISDIFWTLDYLAPTVVQLEGKVASNAAGSLAFLLIVSAINYQFWRRKAGAIVRYHHAGKIGAQALWEAFSSAWGLDDATPDRFRAALAERGVSGVFGDIPDLAGRKKILDEMLFERAVETFCATVIRQGRLLQRVTVADASALARRFPIAFGDPYLKKAQLALAMFSACARGAGISHDAANLTALANYRLPRVLRALGVLRYSNDVAGAVDARHLLPAGSAAERAIRAATILACEEIAAHTGKTAADVEILLWSSRDASSTAPFHLTETTWY